MNSLPYINTQCPFCDHDLQLRGDGINTIYYCNNETDIVFAKARRQEPPPYHSFLYERSLGGFDIKFVHMQFNLNRNLLVRVVLFPQRKVTRVTDRYAANTLLELPYLVEPDFPDLTKLKNKLSTYINFS